MASKRIENLVSESTLAYNNLIIFAEGQMKYARTNEHKAARPFNLLSALDYYGQARDVAYRTYMELPETDPRHLDWKIEYRTCAAIHGAIETHIGMQMWSADTVAHADGNDYAITEARVAEVVARVRAEFGQ